MPYAAKRKNGKWQLEMSRMPKRISVIGGQSIVDEHYMPSDLEVVSMSKLHKYVGSYYGKISEDLKEWKASVTKEYGMWKLREDLQDKGIAVYVTGRMRCLPLLSVMDTERQSLSTIEPGTDGRQHTQRFRHQHPRRGEIDDVIFRPTSS